MISDITFMLDGGELATTQGRVPAVGEEPLIENPVAGGGGQFRVVRIQPAYGGETAHTSMADQVLRGGPLHVVEGRVYVHLERIK